MIIFHIFIYIMYVRSNSSNIRLISRYCVPMRLKLMQFLGSNCQFSTHILFLLPTMRIGQISSHRDFGLYFEIRYCEYRFLNCVFCIYRVLSCVYRFSWIKCIPIDTHILVFEFPINNFNKSAWTSIWKPNILARTLGDKGLDYKDVSCLILRNGISTFIYIYKYIYIT